MDKVQQSGTTTAPVTVIRPPRGWIPINLRELWAYRELLYFFTWRDIKVRYKQTVFGVAWAVIQPLFMMIIFSLFFGTLAKVPCEDNAYHMSTYAKRTDQRVLHKMATSLDSLPVSHFWATNLFC